MTDETKNDILEHVRVLAKSGFYDSEEIFASLEDFLYETPFDHDWAKQQIEKAYTHQLKEQATWPAITDFDKLARAFDKLNSSGIIALHNAGFTRQDGEGDSRQVCEDLLEEGIKTSGFCYYHWQDVERVVDDTNLYIGFGDFDYNDEAAIDIAKKVAAALEGEGFKLDWNETVGTRIRVTNINWQKRFGNDNDSYEHAIDILRKQTN